MRINQFIARATGISRRAADSVIKAGKVRINTAEARLNDRVSEEDIVTVDNEKISLSTAKTIVLNKPEGYVCSRDGQGSKSIYELLPDDLQEIKPVGRLDKDSSGLLLLTNDGHLAQQLTHPSYKKEKIYEVTLDKQLSPQDKQSIQAGVTLTDGMSRLQLSGADKSWTVTMHEGRNRQIRRTFEAVHRRVIKLHRTKFGPYELGALEPGKWLVHLPE